jgi:hypothetical protein
MTIVREEENGNNGYHAGGVCRGGRCPSSLDTRAGALARFGLIDRGVSDDALAAAPSRWHACIHTSQKVEPGVPWAQRLMTGERPSAA